MNRFTRVFATAMMACVLGFASRSGAQEFQESFKQYEFGPLASGGVSVFQGSVPDGAKTDIHVAYTFGILGDYAFNKDFGFALGLGYESRGVYFKAQGASTPNVDMAAGFFSIQPSLKFKAFLLGVNIGLPMSGTAKYTSDLLNTTSTIGSDSLGTIIDIRAAALLPLVENDKGNLDFYIQASYCVSDFFGKNGVILWGIQSDPTKPITKSPVPTLQLGLTYLFSPGGKVYESR
jgi:hypothetical protein